MPIPQRKNMKILILQHAWAINCHTSQLATALCSKGHEVHLFTNLAPDPYSHMPQPDRNLRIHEVTPDPAQYNETLGGLGPLEQIQSHYPLSAKEYNLARKLKAFYLLSADHITAGCPDADLCIGIEKGGLLWAHHLHKATGVPYIYYSLELYPPSVLRPDTLLCTMAKLEPPAHREATGTIIQCDDRANYLYAANKVPPRNTMVMPVSITPPQISSIPPPWGGQKACILFGHSRLDAGQVTDLEAILPEDYIFYSHVPGPDMGFQRIPERRTSRLFTSDALLSEEKIHALLRNARVGFCWYHADNANNRLTAFASEKTARCLAAGLPILANADSNFPSLFAEFRCGETIREMDDIPEALAKIDSSYEAYCNAALQAFQKYYSFPVNFDKLHDSLHTLIHSHRPLRQP